ncbi:MAG TPA: hypothetical protein VGM16_12600 [Gammaproteobacteria bacterium]
MELIVARSGGQDDLERRKRAEVILNIAPREVKPKLRLRRDGKFGRDPGSKALDVVTGQWIVSEDFIDRMRPIAYAKTGIPADLLSVEIMLLYRSFDEYRAEIDAFKGKLRALVQPMVKKANKTRQPAFAYGLLAEALESVVPADAQDDLKLPDRWWPIPESDPGVRLVDIAVKAQEALRPRKRRSRKANR